MDGKRVGFYISFTTSRQHRFGGFMGRKPLGSSDTGNAGGFEKRARTERNQGGDCLSVVRYRQRHYSAGSADYGEKNPDIPADKHWETWSKGYWGWVDGDEEAITKSVEKYANALCDTIFKFGYDGFDLDAEPSYAQPFQTKKELWKERRMHTFLETMGKRIGPKAETEEGRKKLLVVDGEPEWFPAEYGPYMNYFIHQTYGVSSFSTLDSRLQRLVNHFASVHTAEEVANKFIVTEEFEKYGTTGGVSFRLPDGRTVPSYIGMAEWKPFDGKYRKGGIGSYHMQRDFAANPVYKYLRQGIQIMNPATY